MYLCLDSYCFSVLKKNIRLQLIVGDVFVLYSSVALYVSKCSKMRKQCACK